MLLHLPLLLYRKLRHSRGNGIHSPFIYRLITHVIRERASYYRLTEIEAFRKTLPPRLSPPQGPFLFRLAAHLRPERILLIGDSLDLTPLYLASYRPNLTCLALEPSPLSAERTQKLCQRAGLTTLSTQPGHYLHTLPPALRSLGSIDFLYLNGRLLQPEALQHILSLCLPFLQDHSLILCQEIYRHPSMHCFWNHLRRHPRITASLDLFSLGLAFLSPNLPSKNYPIYL